VHDGQRLFNTLFADATLRTAWDAARGRTGQCRVRLWIDTDAAALHTLPWEQLHDGDVWLAANAGTPFSRYLTSTVPWGGPVGERPIRVLAVISNPNDLAKYNLPSIDVRRERELLAQALARLPSERVDLTFLEPPATLPRLEQALRAGYHVLHFVGHGTFSQRRQQAALFLQDAEGNAHIVTDAQISQILKQLPSRPHLVFLAACQSATRSTVDAFAGLGPRLVEAGIPAVVAMQDKVSIQTARQMTPTFYEALMAHGEVDRALNAARNNLLAAGHADAAVPVLFMRLQDAKLFEDAHRVPLSQAYEEERYLDAALAEQVVVGQQTELLTMIRLPDSEGLRGILEVEVKFLAQPDDVQAKPFTIPFPRDKYGNVEPLDLIIQIRTDDFYVSEPTKKVKIQPGQDAGEWIFLMTPKHRGELKLVIEVCQVDAVLASGFLRVNGLTKLEEGLGVVRRTFVTLPLGVFALHKKGEDTPPQGNCQEAKPTVNAEGAYFAGQVVIHGDVVGRDQYNVAGDPERLANAFAVLYQQVAQKPDLPPQEKADVQAELQEVEHELGKGEQADEGFIWRRLRNVKRMAPNILDVVLATFANPALGLGMVAKKVAEKMKAEARLDT
jgi:hypothetical protein